MNVTQRRLLLLYIITLWLRLKSWLVIFLICFQKPRSTEGLLLVHGLRCLFSQQRKTLRCHDLSLSAPRSNPWCGLVSVSHHMTLISLI